MHPLAFVFLAYLTWVTPLSAAPGITCPREKSTSEESIWIIDEGNSLKDWDALYAAFNRYALCDNVNDLEVSGVFTDAMARLLIKDWPHFDRLVFFTAADKPFQWRILNHIEAVTSADALLQIIEKAFRHCPSKGKYLCKKIVDHAMIAIGENNP